MTMVPIVRYRRGQGWPVVEVPSYINLCLGNGTMFKVAVSTLVSHTGEGLFIGIEGHGCYLMPRTPVAPRYVAEKLGLRFQNDAAAVADFINAQQGHQDTTLWGQYGAQWMAEEEVYDG